MDLMSIHVSFLLFESIFCFLSALVSLSDKGFKNKRVMVTLLNISVGLMLLAEFTYYLFKDQDVFSSYIMVRLCCFVDFFICDFLILAYVVYASYIIFGQFSIKKGAPCRFRIILSLFIGVVGIILVIVSQFTGIYYIVDEHNVYHRGPLFLVSVGIPFLAMFIFMTITLQYARKLGARMTIALMSYVLLPLIGGILQYFFYGYSFMEMATGLSVILLFIEGAIDTKREVIRVSKTEVRTGLANEHGCVEWLNSKEDRSELLNYAAIFFDLIKFSEINRKHGMAIGDQFLNNYASSFASFMDEDEILGRAYGNLFVAIVKKNKLKHFVRLLEKMDVTVKEGDNISITETISARAGVYEITKDDMGGEDILTNAGTALSLAKSPRTPDIVYLSQNLLDSFEEQKRIVSDIKVGLANGHFEAYYQPKVNCVSKMLCGAEVLARWRHNGVIKRPGEFIPLMEEFDLICDLDIYMLEQVCKDIKNWLAAGLHPPVISVNVSRRNLKEEDLASKIDKIVMGYGIPKDLIEIEVTERSDEFSVAELKEYVASLHKHGYSASIDDFGCESSSLTLLREINFDTLKIDKGFIDKEQSKDLTILEHIVTLSKALNIGIVAEGVERASQLNTLKSMGVEIIQGYYYDMPLSLEEMTERVRNPIYNK